MFTKIRVFGDSYMYGNELPETDHNEEIRSYIFDKLNVQGEIDDAGRLIVKKTPTKYNGDITDFLVSKFDDYGKRCNDLMFAGVIAKHYNIKDYRNHAIGGSSNISIIAQLIQHLDEIDSSTLVICGITFPYRTTRFSNTTDDVVLSHSLNTSHSIDNKKNTEYLILNEIYGNDSMSLHLNALGQLKTITDILQSTGCTFMIIDPVNIYRETTESTGKIAGGWTFDSIVQARIENFDEKAWKRFDKLIPHVQAEFNELTLPYTLHHPMSIMSKQSKQTQCLLGHPNAQVHKLYAEEFIMPYLETQRKAT